MEMYSYTNVSCHFVSANLGEIAGDQSIVDSIEKNKTANWKGKIWRNYVRNEHRKEYRKVSSQ